MSRAPRGHTAIPQARMGVCACVCHLSGGEGNGRARCSTGLLPMVQASRERPGVAGAAAAAGGGWGGGFRLHY